MTIQTATTKHAATTTSKKNFKGMTMAMEEMVGTTGFEPATSRTPSVRATRLRYVPTGVKPAPLRRHRTTNVKPKQQSSKPERHSVGPDNRTSKSPEMARASQLQVITVPGVREGSRSRGVS